MILGIDVGGTKTLLGMFNSRGELERKQRSLTKETYDDFIDALAGDVAAFIGENIVEVITIAMPGTINRNSGNVISLGHRPWKNIPIVSDLKSRLSFKGKILLENDAKLAGLAEAQNHKNHGIIVYVTISTGIGMAIVVDGKLDPHFIGDEGGFMIVPYEDGFRFWDHIASGSAFQERFGMLASETTDPKIWEQHSRVLAPGFSAIHALLTPDLIITGGGLGMQLDSFREPLLKLLSLPGSTISKTPEFAVAQYGDESVLYGCYAYSQQKQ